MKYYINNTSWINNSTLGFTLIELLVSITLFSIMMVSVIFIFINSSELSAKIDINRALQENSKNIIETIAEDLRKHEIRECWWWISNWCKDTSKKFMTGSELWIGTNHYYLAKKNTLLPWNFIKADNSDCDQIVDQCFIILNWVMLSNSSVKISNLEFDIFSEHIPKVQINFLIKPMVLKWIRWDLIENNEINIQTVLSERYLKQ